MLYAAGRAGSLVVAIAALAACSTTPAGAPGAVLPTTTISSATCPSVTTNHITKKLIQECLSLTPSVSHASHFAPSSAASSRSETSLVVVEPASQSDATLVVSLGSVDNVAAISPTSDPTAGASSVSLSVKDPAPSVVPALASQVDSSLQIEAETDTFLDNANFLSFEEWKVQNLEKVGQSAEHVGQGKNSGGPGQDRSQSGHLESGLDSLGDEGEIEIPFGGFGSDIKSSSKDGKEAPNSGPSNDKDASPGQHTRNKDAGKTSKERFNYASFDCAANVLKTNPRCKSSSAILVENKDRYMLNECRIDNKFIIVELCDDILVDTVVLANFEFFSSMFRTFRLSVSDRFPVKADRWKELGTYEARNSRDIQAFLVENPLIWARYLRIEFLTHYGSEFYCPVSLLRVHGTTMMAEFRHQEELARGELDDEEEEEAETVVPSKETAIAPLPSPASAEALTASTLIAKNTEEAQSSGKPETLSEALSDIPDLTSSSQSISTESSSIHTATLQKPEASPATTSAAEQSDMPSHSIAKQADSYAKAEPSSQTTAGDVALMTGTSSISTMLPPSDAQIAISSSSSVPSVPTTPSPSILLESSTISASSPLDRTTSMLSAPSSSTSTLTSPATAPSAANSTVVDATTRSSMHPSINASSLSTSSAVSSATQSNSSSSPTYPASSISPSMSPSASSSSAAAAAASPSPSSPSPSSTIETSTASSATSLINSSSPSVSSSTSISHSIPSSSISSSRSTASPSGSTNQAHSPPATQESFFKSIHKRLQNLESNTSLSLQYVELQSQLLRDAFGKVERRNIAKTSSFLEALNASVTAELARFKADYDSLWQTTVLELTAQREDARREAAATSDHVRLLADEIISQKRLMAAQATLLLLCLGLVIFARVGSTAGLEAGFVPNLAPRSLKVKDIRRRRFGWDSPWSTPIRADPSPRPGLSSEEERDRASEEDVRRNPRAESIEAHDFANQSSVSDGETDLNASLAVPSIEVDNEEDADEDELLEMVAGSQSAPATPGPSTLLSLFDATNSSTGSADL